MCPGLRKHMGECSAELPAIPFRQIYFDSIHFDLMPVHSNTSSSTRRLSILLDWMTPQQYQANQPIQTNSVEQQHIRKIHHLEEGIFYCRHFSYDSGGLPVNNDDRDCPRCPQQIELESRITSTCVLALANDSHI